MNEQIEKEEILDLTICFMDRALFLAESVSGKENFIAGLLIDTAAYLLVSITGSQTRLTGKGRFIDAAREALGMIEAIMRLLKVRRAIGDVTYASLKADCDAVKARIGAL